ncbi:hypothetical protein [Aeromonas hydrophila]|uniref:hypothetical protein n=1 Tax=Aeromonas hydrophila TaxID=644 RepID=UPI003EC58567
MTGYLNGCHVGAVIGALIGGQTLWILFEGIELANDLLVRRVTRLHEGLGIGTGVAAQLFQARYAPLQ